jgi:hypothetical protein
LKSQPLRRPVAVHPSHDPAAVGSADDFAVVHDLVSGINAHFASSPAGLERFENYNLIPSKCLLFLRGHASPEWLNVTGKKFSVAPELLRRHLRHDQAFVTGARDLHTSPSLPSSSTRVLQLTIPTICKCSVESPSNEPENLQHERRIADVKLKTYFKQLRSNANVGDSVVRGFLLLSKQEYVIEQNISIEVRGTGENWRAVVWLDCGNDLSQSPEGPWSPPPGTQNWETYFFPVIVRPTTDLSLHNSNTQSTTSEDAAHPPPVHRGSDFSSPQGWRAGQNICHLPSQYGTKLDKSVANSDAMYALNETFRFAAAAQGQFLNLLQERINHELSLIGKEDISRFHTISLLNLSYIKASITKHAQSLTEVISVIQNRNSLDWPRNPDSPVAERAAVLLLTDFEYLLRRSRALVRECEQGMSTLANITVLEESRRSAQVATRVQRLTLMATVFIPLSFVSSVWGMNFKEMGVHTPLWWWPVSSVPVLLLSLLIYRLA